MRNQQTMPLREQAMEALQESTTLLEVACNLMEQGNRKEAERLHKEAQNKRHASVLLMAKANAMENGPPGTFSSHFLDSDKSSSH